MAGFKSGMAFWVPAQLSLVKQQERRILLSGDAQWGPRSITCPCGSLEERGSGSFNYSGSSKVCPTICSLTGIRVAGRPLLQRQAVQRRSRAFAVVQLFWPARLAMEESSKGTRAWAKHPKGSEAYRDPEE